MVDKKEINFKIRPDYDSTGYMTEEQLLSIGITPEKKLEYAEEICAL